MATVRRHISCSIDYLLEQTNKWLERVFEIPGNEVRQELLDRKAAGEKLIPSADCEGFDPIKGCPGHPVTDKTIL